MSDMPAVVILSRNGDNLRACVQSILDNQAGCEPADIIVVDDGARTSAPDLPVTWIEGQMPFVFARNANIGIQAAGRDCILMNDDARLMTPQGFTELARVVSAQPTIGVCSAAISGVVCNPMQRRHWPPRLRVIPIMVAFMAVFIPWAIYQAIGPLDERFIGYGYDDNDYCRRVSGAGLLLATWDGCLVDHTGQLPSTFRTRPDINAIYAMNRELYQKKWEGK